MPVGGASDNKRVLLVEGKNDMHVVRHIWFRSHDAEPEFCIIFKKDVDSLLQSIRGEIISEERTTIGILADADDNLVNRWRAVTNRIRDAGIAPPPNLDPLGTIIEGVPRVGVWLMPDNQRPGELEDFIADMIPGSDPVWPLSKAYIDGIPSADRKFTEGKTLRAEVHAWLATREDPRPMGVAIRARDLDVDAHVAATFADWLRRLFN